MNLGIVLKGHLFWRALAIFFSFLTTIMLSRFLEASMTGWFFYVIAWLSFILLFLSLGADSAITYSVASSKIDASTVFVYVLCWTFFCTLLTGVTEWVLTISLRSDKHALPFGSYIFFISGQLLITYMTAIFFGQQKFKTPSIVLAIGNSLFLITFSIFFLLVDLAGHTYTFLYIYLISVFLQGLALALIFLIQHWQSFHLFKIKTGTFKMFFQFSGFAFFANVIYFLFQRSDYWLIGYYYSVDSTLGNYIQAGRLAQLFLVFPGILASFIFPVATSKKEQMHNILPTMIRILFSVTMILTGILLLTGIYLFPFIFGESFDKMYNLFVLLTPGILAASILALLSAYFASVNQVKINALTALVAFVVMLFGDLLFLPVYGVKAAAISNSVGSVFGTVIAVYIYQKQTKQNWRHILFFKKEDLHLIKKLVTIKTNE